MAEAQSVTQMRMPSSRFLAALKELPIALRIRVEEELIAWKQTSCSDGIDRCQLARNIETEHGLSEKDFTTLLGSFAELLEGNVDGVSAWKSCCKDQTLEGPSVPLSKCPSMLGRATKLEDYAGRLQRQPHCSIRAINHALMKNAGKTRPASALRRQMTSAPLSAGKIVWATFSPPPNPDPFAGMPKDTVSVRTALGLGCADETTPFVLFQYLPEPTASLPLHRPTVADAGTYHHFRPNPDPDAPWGLTYPLSPNPQKLNGRPEVVHSQITGKSLVFPYLLTST